MELYLSLVMVFTYCPYWLKDTVVFASFVVNYSGCTCEA